jgi:hypothetical protein
MRGEIRGMRGAGSEKLARALDDAREVLRSLHADLEVVVEKRVLAWEGEGRGSSGGGHALDEVPRGRSLRLREPADGTEGAALIDDRLRGRIDLGGEVRDERRGQVGHHRGADGAIVERLQEALGIAVKRAEGRGEPLLDCMTIHFVDISAPMDSRAGSAYAGLEQRMDSRRNRKVFWPGGEPGTILDLGYGLLVMGYGLKTVGYEIEIWRVEGAQCCPIISL